MIIKNYKGGKTKMEQTQKQNKLEKAIGITFKIVNKTIKYAIPGSFFYEVGKQVGKENPEITQKKGEFYIAALTGETIKGVLYYNILQ